MRKYFLYSQLVLYSALPVSITRWVSQFNDSVDVFQQSTGYVTLMILNCDR